MDKKIRIVNKEAVQINNIFPLHDQVIDCRGPYVYKYHYHDFCEIGITKAGMAKHIIGGQSNDIKRGDIYIVFYGEGHEIKISERWTVQNIYFLPELILSDIKNLISYCPDFWFLFLGSLGLYGSRSISLSIDEPVLLMIESLFDQIHRYKFPASISEKSFKKNCFVNVLILLAEAYKKQNMENTSVSQFMDLRIFDIISIVQNNTQLTLNQLLKKVSGYLALNQRQLNKLFHTSLKMNISQYIIQTKVLRSCKMLLDLSNSITAVSQYYNFYDHSHYIRYFKKHMGISPSQYRRRYARIDDYMLS